MKKPPQQYIKSDGSTSTSSIKYCQKCGSTNLDKDENLVADFDENGWFYRIHYTCKKPSCQHKFSERLMAQQNGLTLK